MTPVRVLQCVYSMHRGGVENWLMHLLRRLKPYRVRFDFLFHIAEPSDFDDEILEYGCKILHCSNLSRPWSYWRNLKAILKHHGPYDAVHSHDVTWNGLVLTAAKHEGIPVRIAHSHNDIARSMPKDTPRRLFSIINLRLSKRYATHGLACSQLAAASYFGSNWRQDPRWQVFYCGEDFSEFHVEGERRECRGSLGIPEGAIVVGHVGSFRDEQKNQKFILDIAEQLAPDHKSVFFLLVGEGGFRKQLEDKARRAGLEGRVMFVGVRSDVPRLMRTSMDMFLFPSLYEGLPSAMVEAQAAGLPCICSEVITSEADIVPELITRMSLTQSPQEWATAILNLRNSDRLISRDRALATVESSPFAISRSIDQLMNIYGGCSVNTTGTEDNL
jgi:glycosyltransferase involved in cell wall biosynthesis